MCEARMLASLRQCQEHRLSDGGCIAKVDCLSTPLTIIRSDSAKFRCIIGSPDSKQADFIVTEHSKMTTHVIEMKGRSYNAEEVTTQLQSTVDSYFGKFDCCNRRLNPCLFAEHHNSVSLGVLRSKRVSWPHGRPVPISARECGKSI